jgi:hypothetical protein
VNVAKKNRVAGIRGEKQRREEPRAVQEYPEETTDLAQLPGDPRSIQAALLADGHLQSAQRRAMVSQLAQVEGNLQVQRAVTAFSRRARPRQGTVSRWHQPNMPSHDNTQAAVQTKPTYSQIQRVEKAEDRFKPKEPYPEVGFRAMPDVQIGMLVINGSAASDELRILASAMIDLRNTKGPKIMRKWVQLFALAEQSGPRIERLGTREQRKQEKTFARYPKLMELQGDVGEKEMEVKRKISLKAKALAEYRGAIASLTYTVATVEQRKTKQKLAGAEKERAAVEKKIEDISGILPKAIDVLTSGKKGILKFLATQVFRAVVQNQYQPELDRLNAEITQLKAIIKQKQKTAMDAEIKKAAAETDTARASVDAADAAIEKAKIDYESSYDAFARRMANLGVRAPRAMRVTERTLTRGAEELNELIEEYIQVSKAPPFTAISTLKGKMERYVSLCLRNDRSEFLYFEHNSLALSMLKDWLKDQRRIGRNMIAELGKGDYLEGVRKAKEQLTRTRERAL